MKRLYCLFLIVLIAVMVGSCANAKSDQVKGIIKPGDKIGEMTVARESSKQYFWLLNVCNFDWTNLTPHSQTAECTISEHSVVGVGDGWLAEETKIESNWEAMSWDLNIDGYHIALDDFGWDDISYSDSGMNVVERRWSVIIRDLSVGKHTIRTSWSVDTSIDDGYDVYQPGKYEYISNITVTE